jgi:excisionase family DNA binding protein
MRHWTKDRTMPQKWITTRQAAEISGYHPKHIPRLIKTGKIKARKFGDVWQVDRVSLLAYLRKAEKLGEKRGPKAGA